MDLAERAGEESLADVHRQPWRTRASRWPRAKQRDRLRDDVVGREQKIAEAPPAMAVDDLEHPTVMVVVLDEVREEKARVEEDHSPRSPYR